MLTSIELLHTLIWAFLGASILVLPVVGIMRRFRWAAILTGLVCWNAACWLSNRGRCPLMSDLASRLTDGRACFERAK
jgi:hypothetical protein